MQNKELLERISRNEKSAFDQFFNRFYTKLTQFAFLYVKNYQAAEDIVADFFFNFLRNKKNVAKIQHVESYLYKSIKYQCFKHIQKSSFNCYLSEIADDSHYFVNHGSPETAYLHDEFEIFISNVIESLPPKRKAIFKMIKYDGLKYQQAADIFEVSLKTIESHMGLAIKELRANLSKYNQIVISKKRIKITDFSALYLLIISSIITI